MEYYYIMIPYVVGYFCTVYLFGYLSQWESRMAPMCLCAAMTWPMLVPMGSFFYGAMAFFEYMRKNNAKCSATHIMDK